MHLPEEFAARMKAMLGEEYDEFVESYDRPVLHALRVNTAKIEQDDYLKINPFSLKEIPWVKEGYYYETEQAEAAGSSAAAKLRPGKHPYHEAGLYYIQEPSAMAVGALAAPKPGERVLDLCAAPGGKTTHLAAQMKGRGVLVANEPHPARAKILAQNVERMGITHAIVTNEYPQTLAARFPGWFDRIVVDAPCSGEGMFLKEEQALIHWSPENVRICAERQDEILEAAARMLRPGGTMVYSTCTFAPEEDEGSIYRFLKAHPDFKVKCVEAYEGFAKGEPEWLLIDECISGTCSDPGTGDVSGDPAAQIQREEVQKAIREALGEESDPAAVSLKDTFRLWPHKLEGEGHYVAVLQREGEEEIDLEAREARMGGMAASKKGSKSGEDGFFGNSEAFGAGKDFGNFGTRKNSGNKKKKKGANLPSRDWEVQSAFENFVYDNLKLMPEEIHPYGEMTMFGDNLYRLPCPMSLNGLKVLRAGLHLGTYLKNRFEPSHALALALRAEDAVRTYTLKDAAEAESYLKGQTLSCDGENGWTLVLVDGYSLGWGKVSGGVLKNHYPKGLRWM